MLQGFFTTIVAGKCFALSSLTISVVASSELEYK